MFSEKVITMLGEGALTTLYMTVASTFFAYCIGLPLGILLIISAKDGLKPIPFLYKVLDVVVNLLRSVPFLILLVLVIPLTRAIVGKSYGPTATIVPLTIAAAPFIARLVESSLREVDPGVVEAAKSMGASNFQIIIKVLIPEARTALITDATVALVTVLGYSAMAGTVGGGGLGDIAIQYGYYRYQTDIMFATVILLVLLVQILQWIGTTLARSLDRRQRS